jgi:ribose transport system permease protein
MADLALEETAGEETVGVGEKTRLRRLFDTRELGIFLVAAALFIYLAVVRTDTFFTTSNIISIAQSISLLTIIAVGMTFVMIAGEIDLSVGSMYGLLAIGLSQQIIVSGWSPAAALPGVVVAGMALGFINGFITTTVKIPSFIVTLGMLALLRGVTLTWISTPPFGRVGGWFDRILGGSAHLSIGARTLEIPAQVFWMIGVVAIASWVLSRTKFGYHVYAVGGNPQAAANAGINVRRTKIACFMVLGALTGLAAAIIVGWLHGVSRSHGQGYELDVIAAVVIGGTNLFGGSGSIIGTFLGATITGLISNGLILLGFQQDSIQIAKGAVIILAVSLDTWIRNRRRIV